MDQVSDSGFSGSDQTLINKHFVTWLRSSLDRTGLTKDHGKEEVVFQSINNVLKQPCRSSCRPFETFESS
jgi:hypothetical protein